MADNDQYNDEYQFADLDTVNPNQDQVESPDDDSTIAGRGYAEPTNIKRNALIVVMLVILAMVLYKFLGSYFSEKRTSDEMASPAATIQPVQIQPTPQPRSPQVTQAVPPPVIVEPRVDEKLAAIDLSQQNTRSEVASINSQLGSVSTSVSTLTQQVAQLNQLISTLSIKMDDQARQIERLVNRTQHPKVVQKKAVRKVVVLPKYYIQAIIPGRAWLIAQNGTTLTVREGTAIPGYGTVKLIDPNQGRITTSSGQVIRFSQTDS